MFTKDTSAAELELLAVVSARQPIKHRPALLHNQIWGAAAHHIPHLVSSASSVQSSPLAACTGTWVQTLQRGSRKWY